MLRWTPTLPISSPLKAGAISEGSVTMTCARGDIHGADDALCTQRLAPAMSFPGADR
jgi:hypothetical protein